MLPNVENYGYYQELVKKGKQKIYTKDLNNTDNNKNIDVTIDTSALNLRVLEGARYPSGNTYVEIEKDSTDKLLELSKVAATGNIDDLVQTTSYVTLYCGSSTEVI